MTDTPALQRSITFRGEPIRALKGPVSADIRIDLQDCKNLVDLPPDITTGSLNLSGCTSLERLPPRLSVAFLDLADCTSLIELPTDLRLRGGRLNLRNCAQLRALPPDIGEVAQLNLSGCMNIRALPEGLNVTSWIDIGGSGIDHLPPRFDHVGLRWRGVAISRRVVFEPHTLDPSEIMEERNAEIRRVMIERYGYDKLLERLQAEELDRDRDAGGERRLLRVDVPGDEPLVCVSVRCPSTGHQFVLRVPPTMRSCRQAIAWTAGFDEPSRYRPVVET